MLSQLSMQEQEAIIKLYIAFFARAPETSGANYWAGEFQKLDSAMSVDQKIDSIADRLLSDSYSFGATVFSADMPLVDFIKQMYLNALGRGETAFSALGRKAAPKQDEIAYWVDEISSGRVTKAGFGLRIFRDSEIFAEGGAAPETEIAKYKFQSAFNATRLAISKEFVKQENSGELQSDRAIIAGREVLKGVPMVRLEGEALSQYISRKLAWPEDPSLYERVAPLSASSLVAEITAEEAAAVGGNLPTADSPFTDLSPAAAPAGGGGFPGGGAAPPPPPVGAAPPVLVPPVIAPAVVAPPPPPPPVPQPPAQRKFDFNDAADGGPEDDDTLELKGNLPRDAMIDLRQQGDQVGKRDLGVRDVRDAFDLFGEVQQNFENVDLSKVTSGNGAIIIAHDNGANIIGSKNRDEIWGGAGFDRIEGRGGGDKITGSLADSLLDGGAGDDTLHLTGALGAATVIDLRKTGDDDQIAVGGSAGNLQKNFEHVNLSGVARGNGATITAHDNGARIIGSRNDDIINGGAGDDIIESAQGSDTIIGGAGDDTIEGGAGNDTIDGGAGVDELTGGGGNDIFFYYAAAGGLGLDGSNSTLGIDTITDFTRNSDKLRFVDGTAKATVGAIETSGVTVDISALGKITGFAVNADYDAKIAAIKADARFGEIKKVAFFEDSNNTYVYHTGVAATHDDDIIINLGLSGVTATIIGVKIDGVDYEDVSFA